MANAEQRNALQGALDGAGIDWELDLYSGTVHAFTNPKSAFSPDPAFAAYHPRNAARAEERTTRFLAELLLDTVPSA
jgi:dienelactone hydrolase